MQFGARRNETSGLPRPRIANGCDPSSTNAPSLIKWLTILEIVAWLSPVTSASSEREIWLSCRRIVFRTSNRLRFRMIAGPRADDMGLRLDFKIHIYSQLGSKGKFYRFEVIGSKFEVLSFGLRAQPRCDDLPGTLNLELPIPERLRRQLEFILEIDRLKGVLRQSYLIDSDRHENSAEHSWHLAVAAMVLTEHAKDRI